MENKKLKKLFEELKLSECIRVFDEIEVLSSKEYLSYSEFLIELLQHEAEVRGHRKTTRMLNDSCLDLRKTIESFDKKRLNKRLLTQTQSLLRGDFLKRTENVIAFGNPGSGKTHLLTAIAQELVRSGHRVFSKTCQQIVELLINHKKENNLSLYLKKLDRYQIILIDDIGYVQKSREEMEVLFTLLAHRYERGSVMITSNLVFSEWEKIFKDPMTTAAVIDRMVHHSVIMDMNLPSYRIGEAENDQPTEE
jgi:DNA replication protein DnaC